jgi:hypothetical protein
MLFRVWRPLNNNSKQALNDSKCLRVGQTQRLDDVSDVSAEALRKLFFCFILWLAGPTQLFSPPKLPDTIQIGAREICIYTGKYCATRRAFPFSSHASRRRLTTAEKNSCLLNVLFARHI